MKNQMIFQRYEFKYLMTRGQQARLLAVELLALLSNGEGSSGVGEHLQRLAEHLLGIENLVECVQLLHGATSESMEWKLTMVFRNMARSFSSWIFCSRSSRSSSS